MLMLLCVLGVVGIIFMTFGFWRHHAETLTDALLIWILNTIVWFVWCYLAIAYTLSLTLTNTYIPTAVGLIGIGIILLCIYKDITLAIESIRSRPRQMTSDEQYEDDKRRNQGHIYNITRRRY